jgi:glycosyl hydrolase family 2
MTTDLPELDVFYGDLTANRAVVYARLPRPADDAGLTLAGQVRGPRCLHAQTLPFSSQLTDLGPGPTLLAQAIVTEPVFWSPDLPAIYDVTVQLKRGTEVLATVRREIGLRSFGVRGRQLVLEGKPWVLRGVSTESTTATYPRAWHESSAAYVAVSSNLEPLAEAAQWGTLAVVNLSQGGTSATARLRELAQHPAVAIVAVEQPLRDDFKKPLVAPNLLFAQVMRADQVPRVLPWADLLLASATNPDRVASVIAQSELPVLAARPLVAPADLAVARAACDMLQRDLAPLGQFAGYIV